MQVHGLHYKPARTFAPTHHLELSDIDALQSTYEEITYQLDLYIPRLKYFSALTEAEARACVEMSSFPGDFTPQEDPKYVARCMREYKIDLKTAEHVYRYDVFPILWFKGFFGDPWFTICYPREWLFRTIDERRQRRKIWQWLSAPYETLVWYCTFWHLKRMGDQMVAELEGDARAHAGDVTGMTTNESASILGGKEATCAAAEPIGSFGERNIVFE